MSYCLQVYAAAEEQEEIRLPPDRLAEWLTNDRSFCLSVRLSVNCIATPKVNPLPPVFELSPGRMVTRRSCEHSQRRTGSNKLACGISCGLRGVSMGREKEDGNTGGFASASTA